MNLIQIGSKLDFKKLLIYDFNWFKNVILIVQEKK